MNILVCISKTPDTTAKINFDASSRHFVEEGVQFIMNPYDEWYALVRAIELKEQVGGQVDVIHMGNSQSDVIIRKALAIGADAAFRVDFTPEDSFQVALAISDFAKTKNYDIIFVGKETIDYNGSEVGAMLAEYMEWPFISYCNRLSYHDSYLELSREIEGGVEILQGTMPMVISAAKGIADQRIPNMKGIMDAKKKPLEVISFSGTDSLIIRKEFELPPPKTGVKMIPADNIQAIVNVFKEDLKII